MARSKNHDTHPTFITIRIATEFMNIKLEDIRIFSDDPDTIYARVYIDGELSLLSGDLEMCFARIREIVEEVRKELKE